MSKKKIAFTSIGIVIVVSFAIWIFFPRYADSSAHVKLWLAANTLKNFYTRNLDGICAKYGTFADLSPEDLGPAAEHVFERPFDRIRKLEVTRIDGPDILVEAVLMRITHDFGALSLEKHPEGGRIAMHFTCVDGALGYRATDEGSIVSTHLIRSFNSEKY